MTAAKDPSKQRWNLDHDPEARPLGCNGKYGQSGLERHYRHKTEPCEACRESSRHYQRELRRGQRYPRILWPCGTWQAAERHRTKGEPVDWPCAQAYRDYNTEKARERRARNRAKVAG
jgi:hypothetical protein